MGIKEDLLSVQRDYDAVVRERDAALEQLSSRNPSFSMLSAKLAAERSKAQEAESIAWSKTRELLAANAEAERLRTELATGKLVPPPEPFTTRLPNQYGNHSVKFDALHRDYLRALDDRSEAMDRHDAVVRERDAARAMHQAARDQCTEVQSRLAEARAEAERLRTELSKASEEIQRHRSGQTHDVGLEHGYNVAAQFREEARDAALEEAAQRVQALINEGWNIGAVYEIATAIRALKSKSQGAK